MTLNAVIFGDLHCRFDDIERVADEIDRSEPPLCLFVGDFGFGDRSRVDGLDHRKWPLLDGRCPDEVLSPLSSLGCRFLYVLGNHDYDNETQYLPILRSETLHWSRNLHGRVVEVDGVRIAGLGGTFKQSAWKPGVDTRYESAEDFLAANPGMVWHTRNPWDGQVEPRAKDRMYPAHRGSIFPDEVEGLRRLRADVLVTHEPPGTDYLRERSPGMGWDLIADLARDMGASALVHGHIHCDYEERLDNGITVLGRGLSHGTSIDLGQFRPNCSDERRLRYA